MADKNKLAAPVSFDFQGHRKRTFKSIEQILRFGQNEYDVWLNFQTTTNSIRPFNSANPVDPSVNVAKIILDQAQAYISNPDPTAREAILNTIKARLQTFSQTPTHVATGSLAGKMVLELAEKRPIAACVLLASITNQTIPHTNIQDILKFSEAVYYAEQAREKPESYIAAHKSLIKEFTDEWEDLIETGREDIQDHTDRADGVTANAEKQASTHARQHKRLFKLFRKQHDDAHNQILALENTYHKALQLEAPAKYWSDRKFNHRVTSFVSAAIFLVGISFALVYARDHGKELLDTLPKDTSNNIGLGAIAVLTIPAVGVAWALRIFTRLFSHNLNMAADAAQRQTMITTYLALSNDPNANLGDDERILILNALFRPSENHGSNDAPPPNLMELAKNVSGKGQSGG